MSEKKFTPDENLKKLGKQVRQLRKGRKWSQQKLSDVSGLAVRTISRIERGVMNPSFEVLTTLVDVLGISFDFLRHIQVGNDGVPAGDTDVIMLGAEIPVDQRYKGKIGR